MQPEISAASQTQNEKLETMRQWNIRQWNIFTGSVAYISLSNMIKYNIYKDTFFKYK